MPKIKSEQIVKLLLSNKFIPKGVSEGLIKNIEKFSQEQLEEISLIFVLKGKKGAKLNEQIKKEKEVVVERYVEKIKKIKDEKLPAFLKIYEEAKRNIEKRGADNLLNDI